MEGEGKICVVITKFDNGYEVRIKNVSKIETMAAFAALSDTIRKHTDEGEWCSIIGTLLVEVYKACGESRYQRLLEIVADTIKEKL